MRVRTRVYRVLSLTFTAADAPKLPPLHYPDRFEVRYVSANGGIRWNRQWVNVSITCAGEYIGLEEIDDGVGNVYFGRYLKTAQTTYALESYCSNDTGDCSPCLRTLL